MEAIPNSFQEPARLDLVAGIPQYPYPKANGDVGALIEAPDGGLIIGGLFTFVGGIQRPGLAHISATGTVLPLRLQSISGSILSLAVNGNILYVGGFISSVNGSPVNNFFAIDMTTNMLLPSMPAFTNAVRKLLIDGSTLYVGGDFYGGASGFGEMRNGTTAWHWEQCACAKASPVAAA